MVVAKAGTGEEIRGIRVETKEGNLSLYLSFLPHNHSQITPHSLPIKGETKGATIKVVTVGMVAARAGTGETREAKGGIKMVTGEGIRATKVEIKAVTGEEIRATKVGAKEATRETKEGTKGIKAEFKVAEINSLLRKVILAALAQMP